MLLRYGKWSLDGTKYFATCDGGVRRDLNQTESTRPFHHAPQETAMKHSSVLPEA